jgi:hemin uptake protein HemP
MGTKRGIHPSSQRTDPGSRRRLNSQELLGGEEEVIIEHAGQEYRLRKTRQDKLILTK